MHQRLDRGFAQQGDGFGVAVEFGHTDQKVLIKLADRVGVVPEQLKILAGLVDAAQGLSPADPALHVDGLVRAEIEVVMPFEQLEHGFGHIGLGAEFGGGRAQPGFEHPADLRRQAACRGDAVMDA